MAEMAKGTHTGKLVVDWTRQACAPDAALLPAQVFDGRGTSALRRECFGWF